MVDSFGVTARDIKGGRVLELSGELDVSTCQGLVSKLVGVPGSLVVIDLSKVSFMDSSDLGVINRARRTAMEEGGVLVVSRPQPMVHRVLQITGLDIWLADWDPQWSAQPDGNGRAETNRSTS